MKEKINAFFEANRENIVQDVFRLVRIASDRGEAKEGMPFGEGPYRALQEALALCADRGMQAENVDNYVMYTDIGSAEPCLDILAHLDVVPVANNWTVCDPFQPIEKDGVLYGRGTADDKGPAVAALYAMLCVKELGADLKGRCRLILGTDEESGSGDIRHYYASNAEAPMTVSPDGDFPVINLEKGHFRAFATAPFAGDGDIVSIAAGFRLNVVPDTAEAVLAGCRAAELESLVRAAAEATKTTISLSELDGQTKIFVQGVGAHAAMPEGGNNALTALLHTLSVLPLQGKDAELLRAAAKLFPHGDYLGAGLGIARSDAASGPLTLSLNMASIADGQMKLAFDSRFCVSANRENMQLPAIANCAAAGWTLSDGPLMAPHHVPEETPFVQTLLKVYEDWTGNEGKCLAIGGGTYVHELENGVAFGATLPGVDNRMHGADEFANVDDLLLMGKIYAQTILELCC